MLKFKQIEEALEAARAAIAAEPQTGSLYYTYASITRIAPGDPMITQMQDRFAKASTGDPGRAYLGHALAKAMVSGRSQTIGALIPTLDHAIFSKFLHTLESELSAQGFNLVVAVTNGNRDYEVSKAKKMLAMGVEGLIVSGLSHNDELTSEARRYGVPLVLTSYYQPDHAFPTIGYDNAKAS